jgi:uncharacterized protein
MTVLAPVSVKDRIPSIDVLRGVALLGILVMNIVAFGLPQAAYADPTVAGGAEGANLGMWFASQVLVEGKMRTIFSMLFGAGVVLLTSRAEERGGGAGAADIYYRRTLWLIAFGLLHAYFIWWGDILYGYGVAGLFLYPFRRQSARFLIVTGLFVLALVVPQAFFGAHHVKTLRAQASLAEVEATAGRPLSDELRDAQDEWREKMKEWKPSPEQVEKEIADHHAGYLTLFERRVEDVSEGQSAGFYRFGFFDVAGMMLLGMGLLKIGVFTAARSRRFYGLMMLAGYGVGVPISAFIAYRDLAANFDLLEVIYGYTGYDLGRLCVALGHIGAVMLICKSGLLRWLTSRLAAVGRMALTNYLATSIVCTAFFDGFGLAEFGRLQRVELLYVMLAIWILQLFLTPVWLRRFRFGPTEWLWRSLTHWRLQPMRSRVPEHETGRPCAA